MKFSSIAVLTAIAGGLCGGANAQGFVFGSGAPAKQEAAPAPNVAVGQRDAKVEIAQRLLARMGMLRELPSGVMTPATQDALRLFASRNGVAYSG